MAVKKILKNNLKESLVDTPQEVIDELISILDKYGFILDPIYKGNNPGRTLFGNVHLQVINPDSWIDDYDMVRDYVPREMINEIHTLEERSDCPITWSFGPNGHSQVTGGLDIMKQYVPDEENSLKVESIGDLDSQGYWNPNDFTSNGYYEHKFDEFPLIKKYNLFSDTDFYKRFLGRLVSDCEYVLGASGGYLGHLWVTDDPKEHCELMREVWRLLDKDGETPARLSLEDIDNYEKELIRRGYKSNSRRESMKKSSKKRSLKEGIKYKFIDTIYDTREEAEEAVEDYAAENYDDWLDDLGDVQIGSLTYSASRVLQAVDPVAYRCGISDYADFLYDDIEEIDDGEGFEFEEEEEVVEEESVRKPVKEAPNYELHPQYDSRKSFYGKARVDTGDKSDRNQLYSYDTLVAEMRNGKPVVYGTYSATTLRHIKDWLKQNGFKADTAKQIMQDYGANKNESLREGWRGSDVIDMDYHGDWADPDLVYDDYTFNYWDIEDALWDMFLEETGYSDSDSDNPEVEAEFDEYVRREAPAYLDDVVAAGYFSKGSKSWHDDYRK